MDTYLAGFADQPGNSKNHQAIVPFGSKVIARNIEKLQGILPDDIIFEVQAKNLSLMDQQMSGNYKEVGVLTNRREDWNINIKGIFLQEVRMK